MRENCPKSCQFCQKVRRDKSENGGEISAFQKNAHNGQVSWQKYSSMSISKILLSNFNEIEPKESSAVPQRLKRKWGGGGGGSDLVRWFKNLFSHHTIKFFTRLPLPHPPTQVRSWKWNGYQKTLEFYNRKNSDFFHCFVRINFISQYFSWKMKQR